MVYFYHNKFLDKKILMNLTPATYIGLAQELTHMLEEYE